MNVYEDAEDGETSRWNPPDRNSQIKVVHDEERDSNVIEFQTAGRLISRGGGLSGKVGTQMCDWERSPFAPYFFEKVVLISGAFFIFRLWVKDQLRKTVEFVLTFIDRRVKQKIWFEFGLQIWFICGFAIRW